MFEFPESNCTLKRSSPFLMISTFWRANSKSLSRSTCELGLRVKGDCENVVLRYCCWFNGESANQRASILGRGASSWTDEAWLNRASRVTAVSILCISIIALLSIDSDSVPALLFTNAFRGYDEARHGATTTSCKPHNVRLRTEAACGAW